MVNVLFVCLGNICRSPTAEGVFRNLVRNAGYGDRITADSSGMMDWHRGKPPDSRSQAAALRRGIDLSGLRARQTQPGDFQRFDYILAMDSGNMMDLRTLCPTGFEDRLHMMLDFAESVPEREVPDPYYGDDGFDHVLDLVENASRGLLNHIIERDLG